MFLDNEVLETIINRFKNKKDCYIKKISQINLIYKIQTISNHCIYHNPQLEDYIYMKAVTTLINLIYNYNF